jgi:hypothetical protein
MAARCRALSSHRVEQVTRWNIPPRDRNRLNGCLAQEGKRELGEGPTFGLRPIRRRSERPSEIKPKKRLDQFR